MGIAGFTVSVNQNEVTTEKGGHYAIEVPTGDFQLLVSLQGVEIYQTSLSILKGERMHFNIILPSVHWDKMEESMGSNTHWGYPHCNRYNDCPINLLAGVRWCWYELLKNPSQSDPNRWCNGNPKYYGWHYDYLNKWQYGYYGFNCSYFINHPEHDHYPLK